MYFYHWFYLKSNFSGTSLLFSDFDFILFTLAIVFGAGTGFMINDYYDITIDRINHNKNKLASITKSQIWIIYTTLNFLCGSITLALLYKYNILQYFYIYPISTFALWFYSYRLKKVFLIGNLVVSALIASLVIFILPYIELEYINPEHSIHLQKLLLLTSLAFLLNLSREIIKDIEDRKGDKIGNCKTLPIVMGVNRTKQIIVFILGSTAIVFLSFLVWLETPTLKLTIFYLVFLFMILIIISYIKFAKTNRHFKAASNLLKILMALGIISVILWI